MAYHGHTPIITTHPYLNQQVNLAAVYARAIRQELVLQRVGTFDCIGGSQGGCTAHQMAVAARRLSFAPRRLVLLDPVPPVGGVPPDVQPVPLRRTLATLATTILTAVAVQGRRDALDEIKHAVEEELMSCSDEVAAITQVALRLAAQGLVENKVESAVQLARQVRSPATCSSDWCPVDTTARLTDLALGLLCKLVGASDESSRVARTTASRCQRPATRSGLADAAHVRKRAWAVFCPASAGDRHDIGDGK